MPSIVKTAILFRGETLNKMLRTQKNGTPDTKSTTVNPLTKTNPFKIKLTPQEIELLRYVDEHRGKPFLQWPVAVRRRAVAESVRAKGYLLRKYGPPETFFPTRTGFELIGWLKSLERTAAEEHSKEAPQDTRLPAGNG
jgi:hypothetical protein